ncbi:MAG: hypothetical protein E7Z96_02550 [Actinomycetaceae bacterium]|nr:hypothetical protein [Actinomycetaceae bacterium]
MTVYPNLDGPVARTSDPVTSWEAAQAISDGQMRASEQAVLSALRTGGAMTDPQIADYVISHGGRWSAQRLRSARADLVRAGLVTPAGVVRPEGSPRRYTIWAATPTQGTLTDEEARHAVA